MHKTVLRLVIDVSEDERGAETLRGSTGVLLFTAAGMVARYGFLTFITKIFRPSAVGQYSQAVSIVTFVGITGILGIQVAQDRFIPVYLTNNEPGKVRAFIKSTFLLVFIFTLALSSIMYVFADIIGSLFSSGSFGDVLRVFSISIIGLAMLEITVYAYRGFERPLYQAGFRRFGISALTLVICLLLFLLDFGETALFVAYPGAVLILAIVALTLFYQKIYSGLPASKPFDFWRVFSYSWPYSFSKAATVFLVFSDIIFLGYFMTDSDVAVYQIAIALSSLILLPLRSFVPVYKPICSKMVEDNSDDLVRLYNLIVRLSLIFSSVLVLGYIFFGEGLLSLMARPSYSVGHYALVVLGAANFVVLLFGPTGPTLQATDYSNVFLKISLMRLFINATLNILFIPLFGLVGAAIATFSSKLAGEVLIYLRIRSAVQARIQIRELWKLGVVLCTTGVIAVLVQRALPVTGNTHTVFGVTLMSIAYFALVYGFVLSKEDKKLAAKVLPDRISAVIFP